MIQPKTLLASGFLSALLGTLLVISLAPTVSGYVRRTDATGTHNLFRKEATGIQFYLNDKVAPGMLNRDGKPIISAESTPASALAQAMASWNGVASATVKFLSVTPTSASQDMTDGKNVIVFADSDATRAIVGSANAVTVTAYTLDDYHIVDSDIIFNPAVLFSTTGAPGTTDLQAVATHELGHALGANHTQLYSAAMFPSLSPVAKGSPAGYLSRFPSADEIAFASAVYPSGSASLGAISGTVTFNGAGPVKYALLNFIDTSSGVTMSGLTGADGKYSLVVPTGNYQVLAEPFNKMVQPGNLYFSASTSIDTAFQASFFGGNSSPGTVVVGSGATATADIQVAPGATALSVDYLVTGGAGASGDLTSLDTLGGLGINSGQSVDLVMTGSGLNSSLLDATSTVRVLGQGVTLRPGSVRIDSSYAGQGFLLLRATIDIAPRATPTLATVFLSKGQDSLSLSGVLKILPPKPAFSSASITNSASYAVSAVSPGEIVSIYGANLGPVTGWNNSDFGYDSTTGGFPSTLGGVKVTFDGVLAPIYYARADLLNVQVPFEVAGKASTQVVVSNDGLDSDPVTLPIADYTPGLYTFNASGKGLGIVVNQDYTLNTAQNPAPKGSYVVVYMTGRGPVNYPVKTGMPVPSPPKLDGGGFTCTIGGLPAGVAFGGWTPTTVGLAQVNVMVPNGVPAGEQPITVTIGGVSSQPGVTLFVR